MHYTILIEHPLIKCNMDDFDKEMYQMNQTRNLALGLIAKSKRCSRNRAVRFEKEAWDYGQEKYPLIVRRMIGGMSVQEALIELEPMEKKQAEQVVAEGELQCPKCKSKRIHRQELQTRSADESATVFCCCSICGKRWKF